MRTTLIFLIIIIFFSTSCKKDKNEETKFGILQGVIVNEFDQPIADVLVELDSKTVTTNANGVYVFSYVPVGSHKVTASKDAYITKTEDAEIFENETSNLDFKLNSGNTFLEISDSVINIESSDINLEVHVFSNASWMVKENSDWIDLSSQSGEGDEEIIINCSENSSDEPRIDTIVFSSGKIVRSLIIKQFMPIKLIKTEGIIGNDNTAVKDSVYLLFNTAIQVKSIKSNWEYCSSEISYKLVNDNKGLMFTFSCAELGGRYPFTINVEDENGQKFDKEIEVPFYNNRLNIEGIITSYKIIDSENKAWISTHTPNRLIEVSLNSFTITKTIELEFQPRYFTVNPYNNLLYVLSGDLFNSVLDNNIYVFNQQSGLLTKKITFKPEADDHPDYPTIYPYDICFTKSGYGIVLLCEDGASGIDWKVIDSSIDDTTYRHQQRVNDYWQYPYFKAVHANYDYSKLLLTEMYGSQNIVILDEATHILHKLKPSYPDQGLFITPNKVNSKIFAAQLYSQFIIDLNGTMSKISSLDNRSDGSADFSYRNGDEGLVYFCDNEYFRLLDYNNGSTPMWCDAIYRLIDFTSSIDGKYAYAYMLNSPYCYFYRFDTDCFYRHLND